jgi:hypothetical protein
MATTQNVNITAVRNTHLVFDLTAISNEPLDLGECNFSQGYSIDVTTNSILNIIYVLIFTNTAKV